MSITKTVLVGLSGGVDSAVAALLLKEQGYDVIGVTMAIWDGDFGLSGKNACYGPDEKEDIEEAQRVSEHLGIPYHVIDCKDSYKQIVLEYFKQEYIAGRTPNPCVRCNQLIKLGILPDSALKSGLVFDYFATGHYARVDFNYDNQRFLLKTGVDEKKDQSYFLYRLSQEQLGRQLFPLGILTKKDVRKIAHSANLPVKDKEESQDFYCGDYKELLQVKDFPGDIVNTAGEVLGEHKGIWNYTIGQRKGIGVFRADPMYVIAINKKENTVVIGTRNELFQSEFIVSDLNWISVPVLTAPQEVRVKIRSVHKASEALIQPIDDGQVKVIFHEPKEAITPGQSAVFYQDDIIVGGGIIQSRI